MKKQFLFGITIGLLGIIALSSCYQKNMEELYPVSTCDTTVTNYASIIKPIIDANCATSGCHDVTTHANNIDLSNYNGLHSIAISSKLVGSIKQDGSANPMPPSGKLDECSIAKVSRWVNKGSQNN